MGYQATTGHTISSHTHLFHLESKILNVTKNPLANDLMYKQNTPDDLNGIQVLSEVFQFSVFSHSLSPETMWMQFLAISSGKSP